MEIIERVRIDKWLWAVRLFKSRSLASSACNAGHVKIAGARVKPSHEVRVGQVISALVNQVHRTVRVSALLEKRVSAKLVADYLDDQTPPEEYARAREEAARASARSSQPMGRPTKRQRRQLLGLLQPDSE